MLWNVSECDNFQKAKNQNLQVEPLLQIKIIMKQIGIDFTQSLEVNGCKHLIVLVDYFSKWVEAEILFDKTAKFVALFLYKQVCWHDSFSLKKF